MGSEMCIRDSLVPVDLSSDMKMPQFKVEEVETDICEESSMIGTT